MRKNILLITLLFLILCVGLTTIRNMPAQEIEELPTIDMKLYFLDPSGQRLVPESRTVEYTGGIIEQVKLVLIELIRGPFTNLLPTVPRSTEVREVFIDEKGCAYIDLSRELLRDHPGGTDGEVSTVDSIIRTLTETFPRDIRKVKILIDSKEADTIAGHVDISRPIVPF
jgi:germination protein M